MTRVERLYALVEYLRSRRGTAVNVAGLAERFGVSRRTIFRDLASLRGEYVPIDSDSGPGGGLRLSGAYSMPPLNFSVNEAAALWLSAAIAMRHHQLPWGGMLGNALDKVIGGMEAGARNRLWKILERMVVGGPASAALAATGKSIGKGVFDICAEGFAEGKRVEFHYRDARGRESFRRVEPHGLLVTEPLWYVLAFDLDRKAPRAFRMDRVRSPIFSREGRFDPNDPRPMFPELTYVREQRMR